MHRFLSLLDRFKRDERGAFLALFGILAIVLIATSGAVVDYTAVEQARTRAQVALDAAALALQPKIYDAPYDIEAAAEALLINRIGDATITVAMNAPVEDTANGALTLSARLTVPLHFVSLVGIQTLSADISSTATRRSINLEVALALDITGSMAGQRVADLKTATEDLIDLVVQDVQTPTYTKMALVPYSMAVNVGAANAVAIRGPVTGYTDITGASWLTVGSSYHRTISAITKANPGRITTSAAHGFLTGDTVNLSNVAGGGFTALNNRSFTITVISTTQFTLNGTSTSTYTGSYTANSGLVTMGTTRIGSAISKQNPGQITTTMDHGLTTGDAVYITSAAGGGFTALNSREFVITRISATVFSLNGVSTSGYSGTYTANSAIIRKCQTNECEVVVTSASHGLANSEYVYITNVGGMTNINSQSNPAYTVTDRTANTFVLEDTNPLTWSSYTSGGRSYCTRPGCQYQYFQSPSGNWNLFQVSTCVTERTSANQFTDAAPSTTIMGRNYPSTSNPCLTSTIVPLSDNKTALKAAVNAMTAGGSTAGHIGVAWAWFMVSPNFGYLWPTASQPANYGEEDLLKIVILMTDGEYNSSYCNGVIGSDSTAGSGSTSDHINCPAPNGSAWTQSETLCKSMKDEDVIVYTVGFDIIANQSAIDLMANCATDAAHAYLAADGDELQEVFTEIGNSISSLRISE